MTPSDTKDEIRKHVQNHLDDDSDEPAEENPADTAKFKRHFDIAYDLCRETLLQSFYWSFAEKQDMLTAIPNERPVFGYTSFMQLPGDWLAMNYANISGQILVQDVEYGIMGRRIVSNVDRLFISYTEDVKDYDMFSPLFSKALGYSIASYICYPIKRNLDLKIHLIRDFQRLEMESIKVEYRNLQDSQRIADNNYTRVRKGFFSGDNDIQLDIPQSPLGGS